MALRTAEQRGFLKKIIHGIEERHYSPLVEPSTKNLLNVFNILRNQRVRLNSQDEEGNIIQVSPAVFRHSLDIGGGSTWETKGVVVKIRQKLPEESVEGEKYLSTIMERDGKEEISVSTCVVVPTTGDEHEKYGDFKRIGDLRIDYIEPNGKYKKGIVDGNDDGYGIPTGEWHIDGQPFDLAITRAYLLLVNKLFGVGTVLPLRAKQKIIDLIC